MANGSGDLQVTGGMPPPPPHPHTAGGGRADRHSLPHKTIRDSESVPLVYWLYVTV
jgi:hypothetical protein